MTAQALDRTHDQRMAALARANRIRCYRAEVKRNVKAGADPLPIVRNPPPELATMRVVDLVMALPKYGTVKARKLMASLMISPVKTVGGLSERQRGVLAEALER